MKEEWIKEVNNMDKKVIKFFNTHFDITGKLIKIIINDYRINSDDFNAANEGINNGPFYIRLNDRINIEDAQLYGVSDIVYDETNKSIDIEGTSYMILDDKSLIEFAKAIDVNIDDCITAIMNDFIVWFMKNIGAL